MTRALHAIFCDDIRHEIGNKFSYMGVYSSNLFVKEMPVTLPKLCVAVTAQTPISHPFKKLDIGLLKDDERILVVEATRDALEIKADIDNEYMPQDAEIFATITNHFVISPFRIEKPLLLRIHAYTESKQLKGGGLRISLLQEPHGGAKT